MIESNEIRTEPTIAWSHWPVNTFLKGDIVKVCWSYDGVHGPVYSEDIYLLIECNISESGSEHWKCLVISESTNGEPRPKSGDMREHVICSEDFELSEIGDWQQIFLIVRAESDSH